MVNKGLSTSLRPYRELFHRCKINFIFVVNIRAPIGAACLDSCSRARDESPAQLKQRFRRLERDSLKLITNDKAFVRSSAFSAPPRFYPVLSTFRDFIGATHEWHSKSCTKFYGAPMLIAEEKTANPQIEVTIDFTNQGLALPINKRLVKLFAMN